MSVSVRTIKRLPLYLRILKSKRDENILNISSTTIAKELGLNSIQVRKDLAIVSKEDGRPGVGFEVNKLINDINDYLDLNKPKNVIIIGAGRLGQALLNYNQFENEINIVKAFDIDNTKCNGKNILNISLLPEVVKQEDVDIGIITVPGVAAQEVCDLMVANGIKSIWNFAPINLSKPKDVFIRNEDLSASLAVLIRQMKK